MAIAFGSSFTQRSYDWTAWKVAQASKNGNHQYNGDGPFDTIYFYDGPEVHLCTIWKDIVPDSIINNGYTQEQNNLDRSDFETNFMLNSNKVIDQVTEQINSLHEVSLTNFYGLPLQNLNYYIAISLSNLNGHYKHMLGASKIKIYGYDGIAVKTQMSDIWIVQLAVITAIADGYATISFINNGAVYLSNVGVSNSTLFNMDYPMFVDLSVKDGYLTNITGGVTIPGIHIADQIIDATNNLVSPQIGDVLMSLSCVSDVSGFSPATPMGSCIFQYHLWYTVE